MKRFVSFSLSLALLAFISIILPACEEDQAPPEETSFIKPPPKQNSDSDSAFKATAGAVDMDNVARVVLNSIQKDDFNLLTSIIPRQPELDQWNKKIEGVPPTNADSLRAHLQADFVKARTAASNAGIKWQRVKILNTTFLKLSSSPHESASLSILLEADEKSFVFNMICVRINLKWFLFEKFKYDSNRTSQ